MESKPTSNPSISTSKSCDMDAARDVTLLGDSYISDPKSKVVCKRWWPPTQGNQKVRIWIIWWEIILKIKNTGHTMRSWSVTPLLTRMKLFNCSWSSGQDQRETLKQTKRTGNFERFHTKTFKFHVCYLYFCLIAVDGYITYIETYISYINHDHVSII